MKRLILLVSVLFGCSPKVTTSVACEHIDNTVVATADYDNGALRVTYLTGEQYIVSPAIKCVITRTPQ